MDLNPGGKNVENTLCQKVSCIRVAWTAHQGIFTSFKGKIFKVKVFNGPFRGGPECHEAVEVLEGRAPLNWSCVMDVLVCQHLLQEGGQCQGKKCPWHTGFAVYCLLFISPGLLPRWHLPWHRGTCSVTPHPREQNSWVPGNLAWRGWFGTDAEMEIAWWRKSNPISMSCLAPHHILSLWWFLNWGAKSCCDSVTKHCRTNFHIKPFLGRKFQLIIVWRKTYSKTWAY